MRAVTWASMTSDGNSAGYRDERHQPGLRAQGQRDADRDQVTNENQQKERTSSARAYRFSASSAKP
jgi:hypothetical protein